MIHTILRLYCLLTHHRWEQKFSNKSISKERTISWKRFTCQRCQHSIVRTRTIKHTK